MKSNQSFDLLVLVSSSLFLEVLGHSHSYPMDDSEKFALLPAKHL
ncbi:hypothetical protein BA6E_121349 [Bacteroidales bacterium 6E]|nr:hypothetical protein BA6E_121349 [Bacteroidales bacterium 6E]